MYEGVSVGFPRLAAIQAALAGAAKRALAIRPGVLDPLKPDVAVIAGQRAGDGVRPMGVLRAIQAAPGQQAGEPGDADAEYLLRQDVIDSRR